MVFAAALNAQSYPAKPIRIIGPAPGASGDFTARLIAQGLTANIGQQVIVDNRGGYGAVDAVTKAAPDGYTLLVYGSTLWIVPLLESASWDAQRDLVPVALLNSTPSTVVVHPSLPVHTVKALITRVNHEVARVLNRPDIRQRFFNEGLEAAGGPPEQLAATMRTETARFAKLIKDAGIRVR